MDMENGNDIAEILYLKLKQHIIAAFTIGGTFFVRFRKFLALPYCYFKFVNWEECTSSRYQVIKDFLYIFFWLKYYPENYSYCRFWEKDRDQWKYYYGSNYDAYQKYKLEKEVQRKEYQIIFSDKEVCQQMCDGTGLKMPRCVGVLDPSEDYRQKFESFFKSGAANQLIVKPARGSSGQGIVFAEYNGDKIHLKKKSHSFDLNSFVIKERCIVQEVVQLDERILMLTSAASFRIVTLLTKSNEILALSGEMLLAVDGGFLSNWSAGGITVGIDLDSGMLMEYGFDKLGLTYKKHPKTGVEFKEFKVPNWKEILTFAKKVQETFPYFKMLGPDIALSKEGPVLYEINATPDLASSEQVVGPYLSVKRIREEFGKYNLLINKYQKHLT